MIHLNGNTYNLKCNYIYDVRNGISYQPLDTLSKRLVLAYNKHVNDIRNYFADPYHRIGILLNAEVRLYFKMYWCQEVQRYGYRDWRAHPNNSPINNAYQHLRKNIYNYPRKKYYIVDFLEDHLHKRVLNHLVEKIHLFLSCTLIYDIKNIIIANLLLLSSYLSRDDVNNLVVCNDDKQIDQIMCYLQYDQVFYYT